MEGGGGGGAGGRGEGGRRAGVGYDLHIHKLFFDF